MIKSMSFRIQVIRGCINLNKKPESKTSAVPCCPINNPRHSYYHRYNQSTKFHSFEMNINNDKNLHENHKNLQGDPTVEKTHHSLWSFWCLDRPALWHYGTWGNFLLNENLKNNENEKINRIITRKFVLDQIY